MRKNMSTHEQRARVFPFLLNILMALTLLIGNAAFPTSARAGGAIIVTTLADNTSNDGQCSLREAIINANNNAATYVNCAPGGVGNDLINFDLSLGMATITLASALPIITDSAGLTIEGHNRNRMTISGNDLVRVFYVSAGAVFTLQNISVTHGNSNDGGGLVNEGTATITHSVFSNNHANIGGGGALNNGGTMTITRSAFSGNSALNDGGGVANSVGTLTIANSTFSNNSANHGGGLINNSGTATILNSSFSDNSATVFEGGGGIVTWGGVAAPTTTIRNTILANSVSGGDCWNHATGILIGSNNIIETTSTCNSIATITSDPMLGSLIGTPAYFPLNAGSPAIDAGNNAVCAAAPVSNTSQNGRARPQGAHCDIGSYEANATLTLQSVGANDGWVLESTETSEVGGTINSTSTVFNLGDDAADKQYRALLHFNTSSLPDTAVIAKVTLKIRKHSTVGADPFTVLGGLRVDMSKPSFGAAALTIGDFQEVAGKPTVAIFDVTPVSNWYSAVLNATGRAYVNLTGATQFRLRFATDDNNNNIADYMKFFSGDYATASARPTLVIEYYVP